MITKRTFQKVAEILKTEVEDTGFRRRLAEAFARIFEAENPRFNREKFFRACGL